MKKKVELPLVDPIYSTYHILACVAASLYNNQSIRNWYLNGIIDLCCERGFLSGFTTPRLSLVGATFHSNPYIERVWYPMKYAKGYINPIIRELLDHGYYVYFHGVDDYYLENKSFYQTRHFNHDGMICGYDQNEKTYTLYAYDSNWVLRSFPVKQESFDKGRRSMYKQGAYGNIFGFKPKNDLISFDPKIALGSIVNYLDSDLKKYPTYGDGQVQGIVVHDYLAMYMDQLFSGAIPYERTDWRIFRLIWEQKKVLAEIISNIEKTTTPFATIGGQYQQIVDEANAIRSMFASHIIKRRDSVLPIIKTKLFSLKNNEQQLLFQLLKKCGE